MAAILVGGIELQPWHVNLDASGPHCVEIKLCFMFEADNRHANGQGETSPPAIQAHPLGDATQVRQQANERGAIQDEACLVPTSADSSGQVKILAPGVAATASYGAAIHDAVQVGIVLDHVPRPATYGEVNPGSGEGLAQGRYHWRSHEHIA